MPRLKKQSQPQPLNEIESKSQWNASMPYPLWPFGTVDPKELAKWGRKHAPKNATIDDVEEAPF